ncbi:MAG: DNA-formamidopyrimidine glycosylase [Candidatus Komeilibacteria bacterium RIFCSPLOWO2_01_FULL_45_10]|uniref:DNA-formamidopyrimidine glycosylase n=1 Tax=Candidatus Komeilibacteria bacterium RIFCSPLOWO2_01_FULL_45_10 TaxID=1798550 RepID=A0A1G2BL67_9BACT|nr:MAG: DNA-formamidopyrimidine glycosylase [Candidatus Komeilibacteria bacterium RIFCSPLOWO2_01_FULL_45_10]
MPELPEVQTVVNHLAAKIKGRIFKSAEIKVPKMVSNNFKSAVLSRKVIGIKRRGKMIIIELSGNRYLLVHLKLTGQLIFVDRQGKASGGGHALENGNIDLTRPNKFTRIILNFKDGGRLLFHDLRKFGWMRIVDKLEVDKVIRQLGVEPLSKEFTLKKFIEILKKRPKLKIKQFLLNQELIAGIGNIYADESLFASGILPSRQVKSLKAEEVKKLRQSVIKKLKEAIKFGGTSVNTFVHPSGERGKFMARLKVYQRGGQKCLCCGKILKKIRLGGRGTVYCFKCQK